MLPERDRSWERATLEKLAFASLHEQRLARRWRTFVRLAWLLFFAALVWLAFNAGRYQSECVHAAHRRD